MLDRQIALHGQAITLQRLSPVSSATVRAFVRGYRAEELTGGIQQGDTLVILSPTTLAAGGWAGLPKRGDKTLIDARLRNVEIADPVRINGEVVRVNLTVRG